MGFNSAFKGYISTMFFKISTYYLWIFITFISIIIIKIIIIIKVEKVIKAEKISKYKDLVTEIQSIGNVKA